MHLIYVSSSSLVFQSGTNHEILDNSGLTTMHIALLRSHWETARILLAIVASQYKPEEKKLGRFNTRDSDGMVVLIAHVSHLTIVR
jgi:hypothetical protein